MRTKNNKEKDLGIFYTPPAVVSFIFDLLNVIKDWEDKKLNRWQSHKSKPHFPSVIDPAVGEGIFLKTAVEKNYTNHNYIFGLDIDKDVVNKWEKIHLLKQFGGNEKDLKAHFFHQNGLDKIHWEQHLSKYRYKLSQEDIKNQQFDAVVGNPPYGGAGLQEDQLNDSTIDNLSNFKILPKDLLKGLKSSQEGLFQKGKKESLKEIFKKRLKSFPIEVLFIERFIQLAKNEEENKPGGKIAVIIPDGILANSSLHYVREFIVEKTKVIAIISLPRETFKKAGTSAKTSILILRKKKENDKNLDYPVFLANTEKLSQDNFDKIVNSFRDFYMTNIKTKTQIVDEEAGIMIRVDKTLKEMMEEKPESRIDPNYWHPKYNFLLKTISSKFKIDKLSNLIKEENITQGDIPRKQKGEKFVNNSEYKIIEGNSFLFTGIDYQKCKFVTKEQYNRLVRTSPKKGDILFVRSGSIGKVVAVSKNLSNFIISGHVNRVFDLKNINSFFITVFLLSKFGQAQLERQQRGVAVVEINFNEFGRIIVPILNNKTQTNIETQYISMTKFHDKAMEAKQRGDEKGYKENLEIAEKMLKELIYKTEQVIRGEREDVV